jgi:pimeloyl-ACP methyl ester carboxylesterase
VTGATPPGEAGVPTATATTAGLQRPDAPQALLLHGIGGSSASFADQFPALGAVRHLIAWDAPGYAASPDPDAAPGMSGYAAAAAALLRGGGPADIVGVSWGGVVATRLALMYPELVRSLVLADTTRGSGRTAQGRDGMAARSAALTADGPRDFAARRGPRLLSDRAAPELADRVVRTMAASVRQPGYGYAAAAMAETDHSAQLADIRVPVLIVVGEHDNVTGVPESQAVAAAIPGARLVVIPGAGHLANQERPAEFNRAVLEFWEEAC